MKLILIAALAASLAAPGNHASDHARSAQSAAHAQAQPKANPQPSLPIAVQNNVERIARALEAANAKQESADERQRAQQDLRDQDSMAKWAFWMFLVGGGEILLTAVGVFLVWRTLVHTRDAAVAARDAVTETRRIGEAQVRAYVNIKSAHIFFIKETAQPVLEYRAQNTGQSPALNFHDAFYLQFFVEGEPVVVTRPVDVSWSADNGANIPAGGEYRGYKTYESISLIPLVQSHWPGKKLLRVSCLIHCKWNDIFGRELTSEARFGGTVRMGGLDANKAAHRHNSSVWQGGEMEQLVIGQDWFDQKMDVPPKPRDKKEDE